MWPPGHTCLCSTWKGGARLDREVWKVRRLSPASSVDPEPSADEAEGLKAPQSTRRGGWSPAHTQEVRTTGLLPRGAVRQTVRSDSTPHQPRDLGQVPCTRHGDASPGERVGRQEHPPPKAGVRMRCDKAGTLLHWQLLSLLHRPGALHTQQGAYKLSAENQKGLDRVRAAGMYRRESLNQARAP